VHIIHHVMSRGIRGVDIFWDEKVGDKIEKGKI
jgi:DUF2075 family protein